MKFNLIYLSIVLTEFLLTFLFRYFDYMVNDAKLYRAKKFCFCFSLIKIRTLFVVKIVSKLLTILSISINTKCWGYLQMKSYPLPLPVNSTSDFEKEIIRKFLFSVVGAMRTKLSLRSFYYNFKEIWLCAKICFLS